MDTKKKIGKLKRYCVRGNEYVLYGVLIAAVVSIGSLMADDVPLFSVPVLIVVVISFLLGAFLYGVGMHFMRKAFNESVKRLEKLGRLDAVLDDLLGGEKILDGKYLFGRFSFVSKGYGVIFLIENVNRVYLTDPTQRSDGVSFLYAEDHTGTHTLGEGSGDKIQKLQTVIDAFDARKRSLGNTGGITLEKQ